jgi:iron complex transport system permease protein
VTEATVPLRDASVWATHVAPLQRRYAFVLSALAFLLVATFLVAVGVGPKFIAPADVLRALYESVLDRADGAQASLDAFIITNIRVPRAVLAVLVGGALAVAGATMQGLFRNPLADPGLVGVSSGAGLAATAMIVLGGAMFGKDFSQMGKFALPIAAFLGALVTTFTIYGVSQRGGRTNVATMLLAGIAIGALCGAGVGIMIYLADDQQLRTIQFWNMGSLSSASWDSLLFAGPVLVLTLILIPRWSHRLNTMLLGESEAQYMGVHVERLKTHLIVLVALAVGASVSLTGGIGFVGLVVPHLIRLMLGPDHRRLLPCSILLGGILLLLADIAARTIHPPAEVPVGIFTALLGSPFFLYLLLKGGPGGVNA